MRLDDIVAFRHTGEIRPVVANEFFFSKNGNCILQWGLQHTSAEQYEVAEPVDLSQLVSRAVFESGTHRRT